MTTKGPAGCGLTCVTESVAQSFSSENRNCVKESPEKDESGIKTLD